MKLIIWATLALMTAFVPVWATPREAADRFVALWNLESDRSAALTPVFDDAFIARRGAEGLLRMLTMLSKDNGDIQIKEIGVSQAEQISFLASSVKDQWVEVSLDLGADDKITGMSIRRAPPPAAATDQNLTSAEIVDRLREYMSGQPEFSGSVLLAKDGKPLYAQAFGMADRAGGRANTLDTPINLGSMNKMFTGLAITQLVAAGKLSFDQTVGHYLPEYPNPQVRDQVTVHHLLTHTSGMGVYWNDAYEQRKDQIQSLQDLLPTFVDEPLDFQPGTKFRYSNSGPVVLGLIIEAVSGMSYYDYIRTRIYAPAGMRNSDHYTKGETASGKATGYYTPKGETAEISNQATLGNIGSPAGGGYASANDMLRFAIALYDDTLIDAKYREIMTSNKQSASSPMGYGYLYGDHEINGKRYIGHNGGAPGVNAEFSVFPDHGYTLVVLANRDHAASPVAEQVKTWLGHAKD